MSIYIFIHLEQTKKLRDPEIFYAFAWNEKIIQPSSTSDTAIWKSYTFIIPLSLGAEIVFLIAEVKSSYAKSHLIISDIE